VTEREQETQPDLEQGGHEEPDDLQSEQEGKGYGEDEGERDAALPAE
jgi:hypothetical protein